MILLGLWATGFMAGSEHPNEFQLKAAFLFNMAKFVEWPPEDFASPADPLVICILGKSEIEDVLRQAPPQKVAGRLLMIRHIADAQRAGGCHILFVSESVGRRWRSRGSTQSMNILTVGESIDFISQGGAVNFQLHGDTIHIQVNIEAVRRAKFVMSSKLLSLSEILK
jgi:hypothetical protein